MKRRVVLISLCVVLVALAVVAVRVVTQRFDAAGDEPAQTVTGIPSVVPAGPLPTEAALRYGWTKTGGDEFDGTAVNTTNWTVYDGDNSINESWSRKQCTVAGGVLTLTGKANTAGTTCGVAWKANQTYGRWEVRARMPRPADPGFAPTFLLWSADNSNLPDAGEIDFSETWNPDRPYTESWLHGPGNIQGPYFKSNPVDLTQWHNFGVDWQPDKITLYLDGQPWGVYDDPKFLPHSPMHLALQLTFISKHAGAPHQTTAQVDWARIYAP